jgi:hypothetical protein
MVATVQLFWLYASQLLLCAFFFLSHRHSLICLPSQYVMEVGQVFVCNHHTCGRSFPTVGALSYHKRSCRPSKKRLQAALSKGKELWEARKRAHTTGGPANAVSFLVSVAPLPRHDTSVGLSLNANSQAFPESQVGRSCPCSH